MNLVALAKGNPKGSTVPGTQLEAFVIEKSDAHDLERDLWLLILQGELIIDLPYGDFRSLKKGDSLHLEKGTSVSFLPLDEVIAVRQVTE